MRINQYVAVASGLSRRAADDAIAAGRVTHNGATATLGLAVDDGDKLTLDGNPLALPAVRTYVLFNKPAGYVSSRTRQGADPTLYELLPPDLHRLRTAGRLDRDSSGLIILSDDGNLIYALTHPGSGKIKRYEITLGHDLTEAHRRQLESGVELSDGPSRVTIESHQGKNVTVTINEGRNRQLRRTFGSLGYTVTRLHRTHMGPYELGGLKSGSWTATTRREVAA